MKTIRFFICAFIAAVVMLVTCFGYYSYTIDYWYSNENYVCRWHTAPTITAKKLNTNSSFYFSQGYSRAITQWHSAISNTVLSLTGDTDDADIICYGDTIDALEIYLGVCIPSSALGVTFFNYSTVGDLDYLGNSKNLGEFSSNIVLCVFDKGLTQNQTKKTFSHEVGHALGWMGHSTNTNDIMCQGISSVTTLTDADKNQIKQIYELYPY